MTQDIFGIQRELSTPLGKHKYFSLKALSEKRSEVKSLPYAIRILLENAIRNYDNFSVTEAHLESLLGWQKTAGKDDIPYSPARVLMQDFTGVPAVVDIASIRSEVARKGKDTEKTNPVVPADMVIDHSVMVEYFGTQSSYRKNVDLEYQRNDERYKLLKWAQKAFTNFGVVPPGMGICHQVNLEYLAKGVIERDGYLFPDTLVGTDSHTPMVNGIGVLGWGVGGIEAEAAMLGQPIYMILPEVIGLKLTGKMREGATSTDLVLTVTRLLRDYGVVGKIVEIFGPGLEHLTVPDRATISNMSPEFGCTDTHWPIDDQTLAYMLKTNRSEAHVEMVKAYAQENMLWRNPQDDIQYTDQIELDLGTVEPTISGPKRPQDKILLKNAKSQIIDLLKESHSRTYIPVMERSGNWANEGGTTAEPVTVSSGIRSVPLKKDDISYNLSDGAVVIAAITSCTNTSNPSVMIGAGLVAKKAIERGLNVKPWVKTSLAPGSRVVTDYLTKAQLLPYLEGLKFHTVGYGCTTCIGNSGDMIPEVQKAVIENDLVVCSALSGNRNFEARIHPNVKMNFLASPMLVVAYAIAGRMDFDMNNEPLGTDPNGQEVYLRDIWPSQQEINEIMDVVVTPEDYKRTYETIFDGDEAWTKLKAPVGNIYEWDEQSTYIQEAPFFKNISEEVPTPQDISGARVLLQLGDMVTTDHISPAGKFLPEHPAGLYLTQHGVSPKDFNSYGSRRGNHEVMMRGTFANVRIRNKLATKEGGWTIYHPTGEEMTVFDAAMKYQKTDTPLIVIGGKEYGSGSSRDWAAKGTTLLGVKAVITESYERIHRSNLVGMGVLPLQFMEGETQDTLGLKGDETFDIHGISTDLTPGKIVDITASNPQGDVVKFQAKLRLDSGVDVEYYKHGGILNYVLRHFLKG
ncbi:aconitate hydratase AcnA [Marinoscillum sp. 108]|uniref:aconitate hydratase AcnA n=1 Tax=Marinoscillum sp. 108 TaxID=2653151 RepID=UPI0012F1C5DC|nr:aconitate hydratase AcnA [Marinoscillum sp. 108]VXD13580.1 aconitate hydratase 1 [Marinoscillum sp. 108]